ncbi:M48 family metalloprotease [Bradyrhizobium erythrophlei]|jgi:predicted Zn-dependent protease|uniref:Putative Zn-dependent protease, contains TPR repeats n=1 Tax=Bradyrhizobium erythrophlei TaxID=1437360 RepID=A0A1M7UWI0_9BRAD|nr:M48 family metalloprotease [Bradyrhizobium erythrophlei]SHN87322.1 Putative Zn-dependent protease, contains TPR repeats [Bradyrhizobium erythrophlei]
MLLRLALLRKTTRLTAIATAIALVAAPTAAFAQEEKLAILRDTETEQLLRDYTKPVLRVAGLERQNIQVTIINQPVFNAFVADGRRIFVNSGALMQSETPNQIIGVLAHETGHLAGGHLSRLREQLAAAQTQMIIAMLLGAGALAAGARSNSNVGLADAGAAVLAGPQNMILRNLLSYQRQQEESADRAGVKFLTATGQSAKGMYETFKRFTNDSLFSAHGADPYYQSHPMPAERVAALEELARSSPYWDKKDDPALQMRHDMVRAKISGFLERSDTVYRRYPLSNTSLPARYAHAIATYLHGDLNNALGQIDSLIQVQPNNPYFYELRGQALLEGGKPTEAIPSLRKAVTLSNNAPLIEILLGQALVGADNKAYTEEAINILRNAMARETEQPLGYTQLAMAFARKGDLAEADLASAQAAFLRGDNKTARDLASRAKTRFAIGTPGWVKADDIVQAKLAGGKKDGPKFQFQTGSSQDRTGRFLGPARQPDSDANQ